jgi:hypothetical protein
MGTNYEFREYANYENTNLRMSNFLMHLKIRNSFQPIRIIHTFVIRSRLFPPLSRILPPCFQCFHIFFGDKFIVESLANE